MLDHADQHLARLVAFLDAAGKLDNTIILVLSDNGASQEGGPRGLVNAMGPFNLRAEPMDEKFARIDDIGGPDTHSNFPLGWAMAANTPLKRYKQNTHGGGIRDPLVLHWPRKVVGAGALRHQSAHASDLVRTLLEVPGVMPPETINGVTQMPLEGESFSASLDNPAAPSKSTAQYFEMFGHRSIWHQGWKAAAFHPMGSKFEDDKWELYHLETDFAEIHDRAAEMPEKLQEMIALWWREAEAHQALPLDDRFAVRFAANGERVQGDRTRFVFHHGMGHVPTDVAPDLRSRSYRIEATATIPESGAEGVLIAHGDATSGYSLYIKDGRLVHDLNIGGEHTIGTSDCKVPVGDCVLGVTAERMTRERAPKIGTGTGRSRYTLLINGEPAGSIATPLGFAMLVSLFGLDIGLDRGSPVSAYLAPFSFTGVLAKVTVTMDSDQTLDGARVGRAEMARQ